MHHPLELDGRWETAKEICYMKSSKILFAVMLSFSAGCSIRAQQLRAHPLNTQRTLDARQQASAHVLIHPFEDLRGGEYGYIYATSFIPVVSLFHLGVTADYPEQSGRLESSQGGRPMVTVGALDSAMPYLLASMMRQMRLTQHATPMDEAGTQVDLRRYDFVVTGRIRKTHFASHVNLVPLGMLSVLGVPYNFVSMEMEYEVDLFRRGAMDTPVAHRTYRYSGSRAVGLYYNLSAYYDLFVEGLEATIPQAVVDVAESIAATNPQVSATGPNRGNDPPTAVQEPASPRDVSTPPRRRRR